MKGLQNNYKGHMDNKGGWKWGREAGRAEVVGRGRGKGRKLYLNNNNEKKRHFNLSWRISLLQFRESNFAVMITLQLSFISVMYMHNHF